MKGIILAGGQGTRLRPATYAMNKHMVPILNKPMILYPLETLKSLGITDILIVSGGNHIGAFADFLGDGSEYGVSLTYRVQKEAGGIAQALLLAEGFIDGPFVVILGDNVFENEGLKLGKDATLFVKSVDDPTRFGVYDPETHLIEEKPVFPPTNLAVTGLYHYPPEVLLYAKTLEPSERGELEITDVNNWCLSYFDVDVVPVPGFWSDAGTPESLARTTAWALQT